MNKKRLIAAICTAAIALSVLPAAGCGQGHEHEVSKWQPSLNKQVTCVENGEEHGVCDVCGDPVFREIPADPQNLALHNYGEWAIEQPTATATGKATKTCSYNCTVNHVHEVTLPVLGDGAYKVEKTEPTVISGGQYIYTLEEETGNVVFTVNLPKKTSIDSVEEAVTLGAYNSLLVRSTAAEVRDQSLYSDYVKGNVTGREVTTYYGGAYGEDKNDYVHIVDADNSVDDWYSYAEDGGVFGVRTSNRTQDGAMRTEVLPHTSTEDMSGFGYSLSYSDFSGLHGAEALLSGLYAASQLGECNYKEEMPSGANGNAYVFSFDKVTDMYNEITVKFTLADNGAVNYLWVEELAYERIKFNLSTGEPVIDENGEKVPEENGKAEVPHYAGFIRLTQTFKTPQDEVPANRFDSDSLYVHGFTVRYDGKKVEEGVPVSIPANASVKLYLSEVTPATASLSYDYPEPYYRTSSGRDIKLTTSYQFEQNVNVYGFYEIEDDSVTLNCREVGLVTIALKTLSGRGEVVLTLDVQPQAPKQDELRVLYYQYNDGDGQESFVWVTRTIWDEIDDIKVGQKAVFKLGASGEGASYADLSFNCEAGILEGSQLNSQNVTLQNIAADSEQAAQYDGQAVIFSASAAGQYTFVLSSAQDADCRIIVYINVAPAPDYSTYFQNGAEYGCTLNYPAKEELTLTVANGESALSGTLTVVLGGSKTIVFSYVLDGSTGKITTQYVSGAKDEQYNTLNFTLAFNGAYKLTVTHADGLSMPVLDENGQGVLDENGNPVTTPTYETRVLERKTPSAQS